MKSKYKTLEELPKKSVITIPGDPANGGRALRILSDSVQLHQIQNLSRSELLDMNFYCKSVQIIINGCFIREIYAHIAGVLT